MNAVQSLRVAAAGCLVLAASAARAEQYAPEFVVGIGLSINDPREAIAAMSELGVGSMRLDAPWAAIENVPGRYHVPEWLEVAVDAANERGIEPLLILAYGHPAYGGDKPRTPAAIEAFAKYSAFVVRHFAGRVRRFDLWNEWDATTGRTTPGTADDYVALARRVYPAIKAANPEATVLSGGISSYGLARGWVERFVELGGLAFVDGLSVHPYNFQERSDNIPESAIAELDRVHALAVAGGRDVPIYVTEMGYPTFAGRGGVSADVASAYLTRFMLLASTRPYVAGVWWYCLRDQGTERANKEHNFGVLDARLRPKPTARALTAVTQLLGGVRRFRVVGADSAERVRATRADGTAVELGWSKADPATPVVADVEAAARESRRR
jgi:hypothetical protein